mmetsp:Transcript_21318/g.43115  ORF Transcript_21318/g.43115 Transcript_21318/m.43115 type:complete len:350 (-) Transcript_21318:115-1164(-)
MHLTANMRGAAGCVFGQAAFGINDALIKLAMERISQPMAVLLRSLLVVPLLAAVAYQRRELIPLSTISRHDMRMTLLRTGGEVGSALTFLLSLQHLPLAIVVAIVLATPLIVTAAGSFLFGDHVGPRRWALVFLGFFGVLVIVRPTSAGINGYLLLAVLSVGTSTVRDLATRCVERVPSTLLALITGVAVLCTHGVIAALFPSATPRARELGLLAACSVLIAVAYLGNIWMMRLGEPSFVQPFRYTLLIWAALLDVLLFGTWPDVWTTLGGSLIAGCGIYSIHCEHRASAVLSSSSRAWSEDGVRSAIASSAAAAEGLPPTLPPEDDSATLVDSGRDTITLQKDTQISR